MIEMSVSVAGAGFGVFDLDMKALHRDLGEAQTENIRERVNEGKLLDGGAMPPSLRVLNALGGMDVTLKDTGSMIEQALQVARYDERKAVVGFISTTDAKKAGWNHFGAKTKNGKWRPRPRAFFGFGKGDQEILQAVVDEAIKDAAKKAEAGR